MRNARTKLVWLADAVCVAYFHAQTGTAMPRVYVSVCVCVAVVSLCLVGSAVNENVLKLFRGVSRGFCIFFAFLLFCLLFWKYLISALTMRQNIPYTYIIKMPMPNIDALCATFATLLLLIFQCQCISILRRCDVRRPPRRRRRQSSGIDLWQRHCILLHLKEIFLEIGTRKKFCWKINVKWHRAGHVRGGG